MELSLSDAARLLGKTQRQVRYMIKGGELPARKVRNRWLINRADLPLSEGRLKAMEVKRERALDIAEEVLRTSDKEKRVYSVCDLDVFKAGREICRDALNRLGQDHVAPGLLHASLLALGRACHQYAQRDKTASFGLARDRAAEAVVELLIPGGLEVLSRGQAETGERGGVRG
ncbi:MAG: helix-turn-helix domain-containing protein [Verrucomicrobiota bacterium]